MLKYKFTYKLNNLQLERLKIAAQWLFDTPEKHFAMNTWVTFEDGHEKDPYYLSLFEDYKSVDLDKGKLVECGSISCFAGTININLSSDPKMYGLYSEILEQQEIPDNWDSFDVLEDYGIAAKFLQLPMIIADRLFLHPNFYQEDITNLEDISKNQVLAKLDKIIKKGKIEFEVTMRHRIDAVRLKSLSENDPCLSFELA